MLPQFTYNPNTFSSQISLENTPIFHPASSGKEKDSETGYYYFGARYYNSDLSLWLSVDPMADKYPSLSPYNYCAWNPVKLVDPDGDSIILSKEAWSVQKEAFLSEFDRNENKIPFTYDEDSKKMYYTGGDNGGNYSEIQKEIIEHYKTLCESEYNVTVHVVKNNYVIKTTEGSITLGKNLDQGMTVNHGNNTADVYISASPLYRCGKDVLVHPQKAAHQSIAILHEIGGHAYYFSKKIYGNDNYNLTTSFENRCRDNFVGQCGIATREIRNGRASEKHR